MTQTVIKSLVSQQIWNTAEAEAFELNFKAEFLSFVKLDATKVKFMKSGQLDFYKETEFIASVPETSLTALFAFKFVNGKKITKYHFVF